MTTEHVYADGIAGEGRPEIVNHTRVLANRNQRAQMLHTHPQGHDCNAGCLGFLPGPPPPTRWSSLVTALRSELAR